jgi:arabinose-5-phosphate isomerase
MSASLRRPVREEVSAKALDALSAELAGVESLRELLAGEEFFRAVELLLACRGRILVSGLGKSGLVGQRIAASLRSTGSPSIFIHPVEAAHGDLGVVDPDDTAILISKSGANAEVCALVPTLRRLGVAIIGITAREDSQLARSVDVVLRLTHAPEIAPLAEVPTVSTTQVQVIGDALTVVLYWLKGFTAEDFAFLHPGGLLGRQLALRVGDVMHRGPQLPVVGEGLRLTDALSVIIEGHLGVAAVVDAQGRLSGVLTDGDFKRILQRHGGNIAGLTVAEVASRDPRTIGRDELLVSALKAMETNRPGAITSLVVIDPQGRPEGIVHIHDILRAPARSQR